MDKSKVGRLLRSMYGWRDAKIRYLPSHDCNWFCAGWSITVHLPPSEEATPCVGTPRRLRAPRLRRQCQMFFAKLQEVCVITNRGILGLTGYHDCVQSIWVLGRLVERTADDVTWEGDPRHAELTRKSFGVTGRSVATPGVRDKLDDIEGEVPIGKEAADRYRANTMRAQYLSSDRPEIQVDCPDLARKMQQPSNLDEM